MVSAFNADLCLLRFARNNRLDDLFDGTGQLSSFLTHGRSRRGNTCDGILAELSRVAVDSRTDHSQLDNKIVVAWDAKKGLSAGAPVGRELGRYYLREELQGGSPIDR